MNKCIEKDTLARRKLQRRLEALLFASKLAVRETGCFYLDSVPALVPDMQLNSPFALPDTLGYGLTQADRRRELAIVGSGRRHCYLIRPSARSSC